MSVLAALVLLGGCGFTPVYGPQGEALPLRGAVRATAPDTDLAYAFVRQIEDRLGKPAATRFDLDYSIATVEEGLAIDGSNNITRFSIEGVIDWTLAPAGSDAVALRGQETSFVSYSATGSTISTQESERDAQRRLATILADKVVTRLLADAPALTR
ncbi:LPS assembly lipoprotein LptE [Jannaschia sp. S6380]|uniref:LPS assembly lipoprotein LptE n=1 Tax=Jannaschia sp. S6380 TaxID=2926408 RepID=UPI001FF2836B|nr:LPS assembly lipoprotein LptE [Jannaschia sp. S6380]MCK0168745.1 LPS assembly lipoprotein LptE [Jannaschia sp. S6380]